jgi:hypothetical protein
MFWSPNDVFEVPCGKCGAMVEFFKDDARRKCKSCGTTVSNPKLNLGCALWCEHAKECLGYDPREKLAQAGGAGGESLEELLISDMKARFGKDTRRINHALAVLGHAKALLREEKGDPRVVLAAAILHDIGIQEAEKKHGSTAGRFQEAEGPPIARAIMEARRMPRDILDHVCLIIANHHSAKNCDTPEFRILWDADKIVNIPDDYKNFTPEQLARFIEKVFKTGTGKKIARGLYLEGGAS